MAAYMDLPAFRARTRMPGPDVDALEASDPGYITQQLSTWSAWIDGRLAKRYEVPFASPPEILLKWLTALVTEPAFERRGVDATDAQIARIAAAADEAKSEIAEAANGETGLFEVPESPASSTTAITRGGTLASSQASPYVWTDEQIAQAQDEDRNGSGTDL